MNDDDEHKDLFADPVKMLEFAPYHEACARAGYDLERAYLLAKNEWMPRRWEIALEEQKAYALRRAILVLHNRRIDQDPPWLHRAADTEEAKLGRWRQACLFAQAVRSMHEALKPLLSGKDFIEEFRKACPDAFSDITAPLPGDTLK